ncbi:MAG: redoxin family protein [Sulfuritalea sp.]|nr:redoxin family protein [Sulfuritalea sp.]
MRFPFRFRNLLLEKRWKRWALEGALIVSALVGITLWQNHGLPLGEAPPLQGMRNDGATVDLARKLGAGDTAASDARAGLVVFWSVWCPVCKAEEGNIEAVAEDWPVYSVAMQSGEAASVSKHLRERGLAVPALVDASGAQAMAWNVRGVPTHFVVDGNGKIRFRVVGYATTWGLKARLWWAETFPA